MAAKNEYKFFEAVEKSFDKATPFTTLGSGSPGTDQTMQCRLSYVFPR